MMSNRLCLLFGAALLAVQAWAQGGGEIRVEQPWARPTVQGQSSGGGYLTLANAGPSADRLLGGRTPAAERVEVHTMAMEGDVMRMRQVEAIDLPAGGKVELKPGGMHLMFTGLKAPLAAGSSFPLTLRFEKAGEVTVQVQIAPRTPDKGHGHSHH